MQENKTGKARGRGMSVSSRPTRHMLRICLKERKKMVRLALIAHACLDSTGKLRQGDYELEASPCYIVRLDTHNPQANKT